MPCRRHNALKDYGIDEQFYDRWSMSFPHGMASYDRIAKLDADMLVRRNIDDLTEMMLQHRTPQPAHWKNTLLTQSLALPL
jgi:alpha-N-acetylglucosamine transferase